MFPLDIPPGPVPTDGSNMLLILIVALVLVIIAIVTGGFKRPVPKMDFSEQDPTTEQIDQLGEDFPLEGTRR